MVGLGRLELPTSRLSGVRSNHLSYRPETRAPASTERDRAACTNADAFMRADLERETKTAATAVLAAEVRASELYMFQVTKVTDRQCRASSIVDP